MHSIPSLNSRRALGLAAASALAIVAAGPSTAGAASYHRAHAVSKHHHRTSTHRSLGRTPAGARLLVQWSGVPNGGQAAGTAYGETYAFGGAAWDVSHHVTYADGTTWNQPSVWADLIDTGTFGPSVGQDSSAESGDEAPDSYCVAAPAGPSQFKVDGRYLQALESAFGRIEQFRGSATARTGLPAGPAIGGRPTVVVTVAVWPTFDRTGASVAIDANTGDVLRITPLDPAWASHSVDVGTWKVVAEPSVAVLSLAGIGIAYDLQFDGPHYPGRCI